MSSKSNLVREKLQDILDGEEPALNLLYQQVTVYLKSEDPQDKMDSRNDILDNYYDVFENVYAETLEALRNIYDIKRLDSDVISLEELLFDKSIEKFEERVDGHLQETEDKLRLFTELSIVMKTESVSIYNNLSYIKMREYADRCEVIADVDGGCEKCQHGEFSVDDVELPPYHTNCGCVIEYIVIDDDGNEVTDEEVIDLVSE